MEEQPGGQVEGDFLGEAGGEPEPRLWDRLGMGTTGGGPGPVVQRLRGEAQGGRLEAQEDGKGGRPCGCEMHRPTSLQHRVKRKFHKLQGGVGGFRVQVGGFEMSIKHTFNKGRKT